MEWRLRIGEEELSHGVNRIREYIALNPIRWFYDVENPGIEGSAPYSLLALSLLVSYIVYY